MTDLFPIEESLSPRLKWMREHEVSTGYDDRFEDVPPWYALHGDTKFMHVWKHYASGETEDQAIANLAKANGWRLWNEEEICRYTP